MVAMCKQAVVVLNCVGPYRFYGEPIVKSCIQNGAHYIDICAKPQFRERMQMGYHNKALDRAVYVYAGSCGFHSIPADMGMLFTQQQFKATQTAVESFLTIITEPERSSGHDVTWQSAVYIFADSRSLHQLRKTSDLKPVPVIGAKVQTRACYVATPAVMVQAAVTLLGELHSIPRRGGVYTPGAAFAKTNLIDRLNKHGIKFSVRSYP